MKTLLYIPRQNYLRNNLLLCSLLIGFFPLQLIGQITHDSQNFNADNGGFNCIFHEVTTGNPDCGVNDLGLTVNRNQAGPVTASTNYIWMQDINGNQNPTCFSKAYDLASLGLTEGERFRIQFQYAANYGSGDASVGFFVKGWTDPGGDGVDLLPTFSSSKFNASGLTFNTFEIPVNATNFPDLSKVVFSFCFDSDGALTANTGAYIVLDNYSLLYFKKPSATYTVLEDCNNNQFSIRVNLTDVGSSSNGVDITDGTTTLTSRPVGVYTFGPYPAATNITIQLKALNYGGLDTSSDPMTGCFFETPIPASGTASESTCSTTFVDSGTSMGNYGNNESGVITLCPDQSGQLIRVNFSSFNTEVNDILTIYNGNSVNATVIGTFSGTNGPGIRTSSDLSGCLTFRFNSNSSGTAPGWTGAITCVPPECSVNITNIAETNCGDGTYDAQVTVNYGFISAGNRIVISEAGGISQTFNTNGSNGTQTFTVSGLAADGLQDNFTARDATNNNCASAVSTFTAGCDCEVMINSIAIANCTEDTYDAAISVTFSDLNSNNQITITETNSGIATTFTASDNMGTQVFVLTGLAADGALENFEARDAVVSICKDIENTFTAPDGCAPIDIIMGVLTEPVYTCNAKFYDSGGPNGNYGESESKSLTICPSAPNTFINVNFTSFSTEDSYDHLWVYNGPTTSSPLISTGQTAPVSDCAPTGAGGHRGTALFSVQSSDITGCLSFFFCSDASFVEPGWVANVTCVPIVCLEITDQQTNACAAGTYSAQLTVKYQFLEPPFQIAMTEQYSGITNTFTATSATGTQIFTLTGLTADAQPDLFSVVHLNNQSEESCSQSTTLVAPPNDCVKSVATMGGSSPVNTCFGTFFDSGGPSGAYGDSESSVMTICPNEPNRAIEVRFINITTETGSDPFFIRNGNSVTSPIISSGNTAPSIISTCNNLGAGGFWGSLSNYKVTSTHSSGCLTFQFCSDLLFTASGWNGEISCVSTVLPLELISFSGKAAEETNHLFWTTSTERNTKEHLIERSLDGQKHWQKIGSVEAAGESQKEINYEWQDEYPLSSAYYRLVTIDMDGKKHYSDAIIIERETDMINTTMQVFPIPTNDVLNIHILASKSSDATTISVINMVGQQVYAEKINLEQGGNERLISLAHFPKGMYLLILENGHEKVLKKIVKK